MPILWGSSHTQTDWKMNSATRKILLITSFTSHSVKHEWIILAPYFNWRERCPGWDMNSSGNRPGIRPYQIFYRDFHEGVSYFFQGYKIAEKYWSRPCGDVREEGSWRTRLSRLLQFEDRNTPYLSLSEVFMDKKIWGILVSDLIWYRDLSWRKL